MNKNEKAMKLVMANAIVIGTILIVSAFVIQLGWTQDLFQTHLLRWYSILAGSLSVCFIASNILCTIPLLTNNEETSDGQLRTATILHYCGWLIMLAWMIVAIVLF